jgi:hypothetical protein
MDPLIQSFYNICYAQCIKLLVDVPYISYGTYEYKHTDKQLIHCA